jgi:hypothetical protein
MNVTPSGIATTRANRLQATSGIGVHPVFNVKRDGRHKACLIADGHLADEPLESVCSGAVSLRGVRLLLFIAELGGPETWITDVGGACLEAKTNKKMWIKAGPEFGELQGHALVTFKALCRLRTSGVRWHERLADCVCEMGFEPPKAEPEIWMRRNGDMHECAAARIDDLAIAAKDPKEIADTLKNKCNFELKGTGPVSFHLGCGFFHDEHGCLRVAPRKHIEKMIATCEQMFGVQPRQSVASRSTRVIIPRWARLMNWTKRV